MSLYKPKDSNIWWLNLRDRHGKRIRESTHWSNKSAAQTVHNQRQVELWNETELAGVSVRTAYTWAHARKAWMGVEKRSASEIYSLSKFERDFDPDALLHGTAAANIETALDFCKTAGTYMRYRTLVMAVFNLAKSRGWIDSVPKVATRKDKKTKTRIWLTHEQWTALYNELPLHMKLMATFAIETGLRQANVLGLRWDHVDLANHRAWVDAADMKSDLALTVPLNTRAVLCLESAKLSRNPEGVFVFTYAGKPITEVKTAFQSACVRAGLGKFTEAGYEGFTWHGLRHTWATWHVQNRTPLDVLQKLGGWADLRMVMHYAHHAPSHLASYAGNTGK